MLVSGALAAGMAAGIYRATDAMGTGMVMTLLRLTVSALPACLAYVGVGWILKVEEIRSVVKR